MQTKTKDKQIKAVKKIVEEISKLDCIVDAEINDWGRFCNFDVHVYPKTDFIAKHGLYRLSNKMRFPSVIKQIKQVLKNYPDIKLREYHLPDRKDIYDRDTQRNVGGIIRNYLSLDLDYLDFDKEQNIFVY